MRRLIIVGVVGFWAVMTATLVREWVLEVRPEFVPGTYRALLTAERRNFRSRMGIHIGREQKRVGQTETLFLYRADGKYEIENVTQAMVAVPGFMAKAGMFSLTTRIRVGKDLGLEALQVILESELVQVEYRGIVKGEVLEVWEEPQGGKGEERLVGKLPVPSGEVVAQSLSPLTVLPPLRKGMRWSMMGIDPLTLGQSKGWQIDMEVTGRERILWEGEEVDTHVVTITSGLFTSKAWVSLDGDVLKESLPFLVTLIKEPAQSKP
jgi:hypothetical protein